MPRLRPYELADTQVDRLGVYPRFDLPTRAGQPTIKDEMDDCVLSAAGNDLPASNVVPSGGEGMTRAKIAAALKIIVPEWQEPPDTVMLVISPLQALDLFLETAWIEHHVSTYEDLGLFIAGMFSGDKVSSRTRNLWSVLTGESSRLDTMPVSVTDRLGITLDGERQCLMWAVDSIRLKVCAANVLVGLGPRSGHYQHGIDFSAYRVATDRVVRIDCVDKVTHMYGAGGE